MSEKKRDPDKTLEVWLHHELVGYLYQIESGDINFEYLSAASRPISLSLPRRAQSYSHKECFAYFDGLLPEGDQQRETIGRKFGVNPRNSFRLLQAIGHDCAGAVSFFSPDSRQKKRNDKHAPILVPEGDLEKYILELPKNPLFMNKNNHIRISLAGAQAKGAVIFKDNKIWLPSVNTPTTHILKPAIADLDETVENEYFCLKLAKNVGINTPDAFMRTARSTKYLLIERYDRIVANEHIKRIHQEDFCQALNIASRIKYENDGGPNVKDCTELLFKTTVPAQSRHLFLEMLAFNFLIGNMDAHGKNYSLLHKDDRTIQLSPIYDCSCTSVYTELSTKLAMKIGGKYEAEKIQARHWQRMCQEVGFSYPSFRKMLIRLATELPVKSNEELKTYQSLFDSSATLKKIVKIIEKNCSITLKRLEAGI